MSSLTQATGGGLIPAPAVFVLEDGSIHRGFAYGAVGESFGEAVFTTGMSGYQETLTDPSYCRQIVVATAPQIGNTGWNLEDGESRVDGATDSSGKVWVSGFVIRDSSRRASNWRSERTLESELAEQGIVGISGVDTRAIVRRLRDHGSMKAGIFSGEALTNSGTEELVEKVRGQDSMAGANLSAEVSTTSAYVVSPDEATLRVAALDLGIKSNTPRMLAQRGIEVHVLPHDATLDDIKALNPDGVFLSNGPGDPATADAAVELTAQVLGEKIPFFGICFGNQILGRALGLDTFKMRFGHRGINIPVKELSTGKVAITSQNHGFALKAPENGEWDSPFGRAKVTHVCANDDVVEGVALADGSAFSVQYHPEAAAGPHDASDLFDKFFDLMSGRKTAAGTGKAAQ